MVEFVTGDSEENAVDTFAERGQAQKDVGEGIVIDWTKV